MIDRVWALLLLTLEPRETSILARVCGNCIHSNFGLMRYRSLAPLRRLMKLYDEKALTVPNETLFTTGMVEAMIDFQRVYAWRSKCKLGQIVVGMFDVACYAWKPKF